MGGLSGAVWSNNTVGVPFSFSRFPSGVLGIVLPLTRLPHTLPTTEKTIDVPGLCTMTIFLVALLLALSQGQQYGWGSRYILGLFGMSRVFPRACSSSRNCGSAHPIVHLRLYRNVPFVLASLVVFLDNAGFMGANFLVALMVQLVLDFTPMQAGIILASWRSSSWGSSASWPVASPTVPDHRISWCGLVSYLFAIDMYWFSTLSPFVHIGTMTLLVMLQRGAFGMIYSASDTAIMRMLPAADRSMGTGLQNTHRGIAMAFGVALCSVLLEKRLAFHQPLSAGARLGDLPGLFARHWRWLPGGPGASVVVSYSDITRTSCSL